MHYNIRKNFQEILLFQYQCLFPHFLLYIQFLTILLIFFLKILLKNFQNYLIKQGLSPARIRVLRSSISSLSNFIENILDEEEKYENFRNIVNKIPAPTLQAVREKTVISDEEVEILLDTLVKKNKIQLACFVAMAAYSGARKSELVQYKTTFFKDENVRNNKLITGVPIVAQQLTNPTEP